ncbi:amidase [Nitratireductor thuwali]|uniref:Amidase AmiD n=1 Tax=Nitratireductor thuwali TaxID=2267699 RepID=A0ABY5MJ86_9HYPH|nr:Putative amidase AmiD [Nitratireductor thuwali]
MTSTRDPLNAFLDYPDVPVPNAQNGPLRGLGLGVKDIYDVAGLPTGGGNPRREKIVGVAASTAPAIDALLDAGARFIGKTQTDELTYSMIGMNAHFPAPVNPRAPDRVTGGSSSGSAAAVAGGLADIAAGSDTNGSIRAPASFCGLIGLRTTHGRIPLEGAMPLSPSFDTFGWFARDARTYAAVGEVLLGEDTHEVELFRPVRIREIEALLFGEEERSAYVQLLGHVLDHFERDAVYLGLPGDTAELFERFKEVQAFEAWQVHGEFLSSNDAGLGPGVKERFAYARSVTEGRAEAARQRQRDFKADMAALMDGDMIVVMPSQPSAAPLKIATQDELEKYRAKALTMTSIAGLLGYPQITLPLGEVHGAPFGISLMGPAGSDRQLVLLAQAILSATGSR